MVSRQVKMPDDVFHHHDRVIDQDADAEDQREERDPIQRESVQVKDQQRQGQGCRNGHGHDPGLTPPQGQPDEQRDADHRDTHVEQELVGFLGGRLTVVAGDRDRHIRRYYGALQRLDLLQDIFGHRNRIGPRTLADGQRDGGFFAARARRVGGGSPAMEHVVGGLLRAIQHLSHLTQINRSSPQRAHYHIAHLLGGPEECAGLDDHRLIHRGQFTTAELAVGLLQHRNDAHRAQSAGGQTRGIQEHPQFSTGPADDRRLGDLRHLLHRIINLGHQATQGQVVVSPAVEGQRQDGDIVDGTGLDQRESHPMRHPVPIGAEFFRHLHQTGIGIRAHLEADDGQGLPFPGLRVEVLHAGHLPEQFFHGSCGPLLDLLRRRPWHRHHHIHHRHQDLRLFFARQHQNREGPEQHRGEHDERGELGVDEGVSDPARQPMD